MSKPTLQIIIGSTRPGRVGEAVGAWIYERAVAHGGFEVELIDLAQVGLPLFNEPRHPRLGQYEYQHTKDWSATIARGDAYILVIPEYNHGFNAATKNALDYLHAEWQNKPVGFVSYGGVAAGTRALQMLKPVVAALKMVPVVEAVNIPFVAQLIGDDGKLQASDLMDAAAEAELAQLLALARALRPLREPETAGVTS